VPVPKILHWQAVRTARFLDSLRDARILTIMALPNGFTTAYRAERATPRARAHRTPISVRLGRAAGRLIPNWAEFRSLVLTAGGLGLVDTAGFRYSLIVGLIATGISALVLDWKLGGTE